MGGKKKDEKIVVTTYGGQSEGVTGSITEISYKKDDNSRGFILLEMGGIQGNNTVLGEYQENKKLLEDIPIEDVEYVFIAHSHQDHEMHLPYLSANNFKGRIIMTKENLEISKKLLLDSTYIHGKNIEYLKSKGKKVKPFYSEQNCYEVFDKIDTYDINKIYKLNDNLSFRFRTNSHVVGSTQIELFIKKPSGQIKKILYTSDLGSPMNKEFQPFLKDNYIVNKANLVLMESTYGSSERSFSRKDCIKERDELKSLIQEFVLNNHRNLMIPCFSYGRLQSMMVFVYENYKDTWNMEIPIVVDTALGNDINTVYEKILEGEELEYWKEVKSWKAFKFIKDYKGTITFLSTKQNGLIFSSSGMISAGHSVIYAKQLLGNSNDCIAFCGYCSPNTIGGKILNESQRTVKIEDSVVLKRCTIKRFSTFSSHAQQIDLVNYIKQLNCDQIVLHHGDTESKMELKIVANEELRKINKTTKITCSYKNMQIVL